MSAPSPSLGFGPADVPETTRHYAYSIAIAMQREVEIRAERTLTMYNTNPAENPWTFYVQSVRTVSPASQLVAIVSPVIVGAMHRCPTLENGRRCNNAIAYADGRYHCREHQP